MSHMFEAYSVSARRLLWLAVIFGLLFFALVGRLVYLHTIADPFLRAQGEARSLRVVETPGVRGSIVDRHGEPLAISASVYSVAIDPFLIKDLIEKYDYRPFGEFIWPTYPELLDLVAPDSKRRFLYVKHHAAPTLAANIKALRLPGVHLEKTYRRYYPTSEVTSHLLGFTGHDLSGQEGLERLYDEQLRGRPGRKKVLKDLYGRVIKDIALLQTAEPGESVQLSIDRRLQYLAYRHLKSAVQKHKAEAGSAIVVDPRTGEVLALVNQPTFNPNDSSQRQASNYRNRAVTDVFEPGSTVKPFTVAAVLDNGIFNMSSQFDVSPGRMNLGRFVIRDTRDFGVIPMVDVIRKSSNIATAQMALLMEPNTIWQAFSDVGFGALTDMNFPGESQGSMTQNRRWTEATRASFAYGYGLSVTGVQLAQAYAVLANRGVKVPLTLKKRSFVPAGRRVIPARVARDVMNMLGTVVEPGGTASQAHLEHYYVGGKTGTVRAVSASGGYSEDQYHALFAGMVPLNDPQLVVVVVIHKPRGEEYYGGSVAAPAFAKIAAGSLRLLNISPDNVAGVPWQIKTVKQLVQNE